MRTLRLGTGPALVLLVMMVVAPAAFAPPPPPGDGLWSLRSSRAGDDAGRAVAVNPDGEFVVAADLDTDAVDSSLLWFDMTTAGAGDASGGYGAGDGLAETTNALALDAGGAPFLAGSITGTMARLDYLLTRSNADGSFSGEKSYDGPSHGNDAALAVVTDASGASYVTGSSQSNRTSGDQDIVTIKYDGAGLKSWTKRFDGAAHGLDRPAAIAVRSGYVYVAGRSRRTGHGDDVVVIKYRATTGALVWTAYYDGAQHRNERITDLVVTPSGIYVGGSGRSTGTTADALLVKFAFNGTRKWAKYTGGAAGGDMWNDLEWTGSAVGAAGAIYRTATGSDAMTAAWRPDGTVAWRRTFSSTGVYDDIAVALTTEATGAVYVACTCEGATDTDIRALGYDADGVTLWASTPFGYFGGEDDVAVDVAVSGSTVAVVGVSHTPADGDDYLVLGIQK